MRRGTEGPGKARPRKEGVQGAAPHIPLPWQFLMIFGNNLLGLKHRIFGSNKSQESGYDPIVRAQDFDGIRRIHISRFLTSVIEPELRGS